MILASSSPRRIELLRNLGLAFEVVEPKVNETPDRPLSPLQQIRWAAEIKARAVAAQSADAVVIGADTGVVLAGKLYGKPVSNEDARRVLLSLRARTHVVYTAVHVIDTRARKEARGFSRTSVTMRRASTQEIEAYVRSGEVRDKAGAYAIQGAGAKLVSKIQGPFDNVVGMPVHTVRRLLRRVGFQVPGSRPAG